MSEPTMADSAAPESPVVVETPPVAPPVAEAPVDAPAVAEVQETPVAVVERHEEEFVPVEAALTLEERVPVGSTFTRTTFGWSVRVMYGGSLRLAGDGETMDNALQDAGV